MSKEVVRYLVKAGSECSEMVYASDYDALLEENQRLESAWKVDVLNRKDELIAKQEKENDRVKAEREALIAERDRLRGALERFYNANQTRLKLLSRDVYLDMQRLPGMRDALYEMDDAQHQAHAALQGAQP